MKCIKSKRLHPWPLLFGFHLNLNGCVLNTTVLHHPNACFPSHSSTQSAIHSALTEFSKSGLSGEKLFGVKSKLKILRNIRLKCLFLREDAKSQASSQMDQTPKAPQVPLLIPGSSSSTSSCLSDIWALLPEPIHPAKKTHFSCL